MKKVLAILMITNFMWACSNHKHSEHNDATDSTAVKHPEHETNAEELVLNDGVKWKADNSTDKNVENLLTIINAFNNGTDKSLAAYIKAADDLQKGLDKMISECKMQGPDHDALHKWLMPLMGQVKELKQVSNETDAAKSFQAIGEHVNLFSQYFEQ